MKKKPPQNLVKQIRAKLEVTQEDFARLMHVTFGTVNRWENEHTEPKGDNKALLDSLWIALQRNKPVTVEIALRAAFTRTDLFQAIHQLLEN